LRPIFILSFNLSLGSVTLSADNPFGEPSTFIDPLANQTTCQRDLPYLQNLTINTIRVYSVNSSLNHDACMNAFSAAGIYVMCVFIEVFCSPSLILSHSIDLSLPGSGSIDRDDPAWTTDLLDLYLETINAFSQYPNVLAFNVGNEVVSNVTTTDTLPFVKAAARDIKAYL
jgi:1,3-beta-glucanosyltransferase GAS1